LNIISTTNEPTHLDLFSGIGGFALAARWAGFRTIGFCDNEPYAQAVIKKHWPEVPIHGDIKALDGTAYRGITLLTGGFPCQDISYAKSWTTNGKFESNGIDGQRSGLWFEMQRIIKESRPKFVVAENVQALTNQGLDVVLQSLADIGYDAEWQVVSAAMFGAPHLRKRIWIVAYPISLGRKHESIIFSEEFGKEIRRSPEWESCGTICKVNGKKIMPESFGIYDGIPTRPYRRERIRGLGNAIVPQVAYEILKAIRSI
jgi:DNA (cytosine-5)-methyltransferase 1